MVKTDKIKIPSKKILSVLLLEYGINYLIFFVIVTFLIGIAAVIFDYKLFVVALLWIFIVIPMGMILLFFIYGMLPLTTYNTILHHYEFDNNNISLIIAPIVEDSEEKQSDLKERRFEIKYEDIKKMKYDSEGIILICDNPNKGVCYLPFASFPDKESLDRVITLLTNKN